MGGAFGQIKELYKLQKEARAMQKKMKAIHVTGKSEDELVEITINGTQEIEEIEIEERLLSAEEKKALVKGLKQAMKDAQKRLQKEMMKDMDINQLKGMLGS
ncbi:MAG: Nucleoid-associated protein YbaB [candidate division WS6 bacterium OLB20]|uniref:Nucleoid-associated protein YbaB n=1 Tax=candidate division WS6 bacterium OLB20 TaxID=1617426 RepID=A0A136LYA6_9BACT|nr:MAG: Nucleoid-associated protein YbaB [candidate division WS6 bacterium OLB20]